MKRITGDHAVIGLGFGDEGKGHVVDWLCAHATAPVVCRFSGGPQAAHHVVLPDGRDHVSSHFGSGTLRGAPTYWSEFCATNPISLINEYADLVSKGFSPVLNIAARSPVITPYEIATNKHDEVDNRHGSCGGGIFATVRRERENYHIWFEDLFHPAALKIKMEQLHKVYGYSEEAISLDDFYWSCEEAVKADGIDGTPTCISTLQPTIFEGSQGLLLDQDYGFFPHVTPSNTGTKNILKLNYGAPPAQVWLVTRTYQTRHGAGPMTNTLDEGIRINPYENNRDDGPQGVFRRGLLDLDLLRYAGMKDPYVDGANMVVTCMDLLEEPYRLYEDGKALVCASKEDFLKRIRTAVGATAVYVSDGPTANDIRKVE